MTYLKVFKYQHAIPSDWNPVKARFTEKDGKKYVVLAEKNHHFSPAARILGGFLCVALAVACVWAACTPSWTGTGITSAGSLTGVWLLWKPLKNLATNAPRKIGLAVLTEADYKNEKSLRNGIDLSEEILQEAAKACPRGYCPQGVNKNFLGHTGVFTLEKAPGIIFKPCTSARYENMLKGRMVIQQNNLDLLEIPGARFYRVKVSNGIEQFIAERMLDIPTHKNGMEDDFKYYASSLDETIRQLALFICKTGYCDVLPENNPVIPKSLDAKGRRKIALLDLDEMLSPQMGLFGCTYRPKGLVHQVTPKQADAVKQIALEHNIS